MNNSNLIEIILVDYLKANQEASGSLDVDTDMIESGQLDSLLVMDLIAFIESRFAIKMDPADITPSNLRSIRHLAQCVSEKLSQAGKAA